MIITQAAFALGTPITGALAYDRYFGQKTDHFSARVFSLVVLTGLTYVSCASTGFPFAVVFSIGLVALYAFSSYQSYLLACRYQQLRNDEKSQREEQDRLRSQIGVLKDQKQILQNAVDANINKHRTLVKEKNNLIKQKQVLDEQYKDLVDEYGKLSDDKQRIVTNYNKIWPLYKKTIEEYNNLVGKFNHLLNRFNSVSKANQFIKEVWSDLVTQRNEAWTHITSQGKQIQKLTDRISTLAAELAFYESDEVF